MQRRKHEKIEKHGTGWLNNIEDGHPQQEEKEQHQEEEE